MRNYPLFKRYWHRLPFEEDDHYIDSTLFKYKHEDFGDLLYFYTTVEAVTPHGELYFLTYIPADKKTSKVFADIFAECPRETVPYLISPKWPDKDAMF